MFCPKCGSPLIRQNGALVCLPGDMWIAPIVEQMLEERYAPAAPAQSPLPPYTPQIHGGFRWWCPRCGKHLRDLVVVLVELHPHRRT